MTRTTAWILLTYLLGLIGCTYERDGYQAWTAAERYAWESEDNKAAEQFRRALCLFRRAGQTAAEHRVALRYGEVLFGHVGEYDDQELIELSCAAEAWAVAHGEFELASLASDLLASVLNSQAKHAAALDAAENALAHAERITDPARRKSRTERRLEALLSKATALRGRGSIDEAAAVYSAVGAAVRNAEDELTAYDRYAFRRRALLQMIAMLNEDGRAEAALESIRNLEALLWRWERNAAYVWRLRAAYEKSTAYEALGQFEEADFALTEAYFRAWSREEKNDAIRASRRRTLLRARWALALLNAEHFDREEVDRLFDEAAMAAAFVEDDEARQRLGRDLLQLFEKRIDEYANAKKIPPQFAALDGMNAIALVLKDPRFLLEATDKYVSAIADFPGWGFQLDRLTANTEWTDALFAGELAGWWHIRDCLAHAYLKTGLSEKGDVVWLDAIERVLSKTSSEPRDRQTRLLRANALYARAVNVADAADRRDHEVVGDLDQARRLYRSVDMPLREFLCWISLAEHHRDWGRYGEALAALDRAFAGPPPLPPQNLVTYMWIRADIYRKQGLLQDAASVYREMADYARESDLEQAFVTYRLREAITLADAGERTRPFQIISELGAVTRAVAARMSGTPEETRFAMGFLEEALTLGRRLDLPLDRPELGELRDQFESLVDTFGDYPQRVLAEPERYDPEGVRLTVEWLGFRAEILRALDRTEEAEVALSKLIAFLDEVKERMHAFTWQAKQYGAYLSRATLRHCRQRRYKEAVLDYRAAQRVIAPDAGLPGEPWFRQSLTTQFGQASCLWALNRAGDRRQALRFYRGYLQHLNDEQYGVVGYVLERGELVAREWNRIAQCLTALADDDPEEALMWCDHLRARLYWDVLVLSALRGEVGPEESGVLETYFDTAARIAAARHARESLTEPEAQRQADHQIRALSTKLAGLRQALSERTLRKLQLRELRRQPVTVSEIRSELSDGELVVEFLLNDFDAVVFAVSRERVEVFELKIGSKRLADLIGAFRQSVEAPADTKWVDLGRHLWQKLITDARPIGRPDTQPARGRRTLEQHIFSARRIIIIPQGPLQRLPFEALVVGKGADPQQTLLGALYESDQSEGVAAAPAGLSYAPAAAVLVKLRQDVLPSKRRQHAAGDILVISDALYSQAQVDRHRAAPVSERPISTAERLLLKMRPASPDQLARCYQAIAHLPLMVDASREPRPRLPGSVLQAAVLQAEAEERLVTSRLDVQATEGSFWSLAPEHLVTVIGTHGALTSFGNAGHLGRILFTPGAGGKRDDGELSAVELLSACALPDDYPWHLRASELIVLSACSTAEGPVVRGEGVVGLPFAILSAGAPRVVATHWAIDDESTALFLTSFFQHLDTMPPDSALVQAKAELATVHGYSDPRYWAPFVLMGEPDGRLLRKEW